jgi:hypothetical protein
MLAATARNAYFYGTKVARRMKQSSQLARARLADLSDDLRARLPPARLFRTLTMPNGQKIRVMREDAFRSAVQASNKPPR